MIERSVNFVVLTGKVRRTPIARETTNNTVTNVEVEVVNTWRNKQTGKIKRKTVVVDCVAWGKAAERIAAFIKRGDYVKIIGILNSRLRNDYKYPTLEVKIVQISRFEPKTYSKNHNHTNNEKTSENEQEVVLMEENENNE